MAIIASQSFELEPTGSQYSSAAADGRVVADGAIVDIENNDGQSVVESTAASDGTLGFDATWQNTRNDVGLSDGDFVGVTNFTGTVGSYPDGSQGYQLSDADGQFILTFDSVDVSGFDNVTLSLDYFVQETGWESDDAITIEVVTDAGTVTVLNTTGSDIDDLGIEGSFIPGSVALPADATTAQLVVTLDSNAATEALYIDNIVFAGDPVTPAATPLISEFQPNPDGVDPSTVTFELSGEPGTEFSGWILSIESDSSGQGTIDRAAEVAGTFDANGLLTVGVPDLENPSFTVVLTSEFNGSVGDTIDTNADGTLDVDTAALFGTVFDAIGIPDAVGDEAFLYGEQLGGTDFAFTGTEPELVFRDGTTGDLYAVNDVVDGSEVVDVNGTVIDPASFDTNPIVFDTFGVTNPSLLVIDDPAGATLAIAADSPSISEGDSGTTALTFTVTRGGDTTGETTVDFTVGGDVDADDFGGTLPSGTVTFADGETTATLTLNVSGDTTFEADEAVTATLANPSEGATLTTATATTTLLNDDAPTLTSISEIQGEGHVSPFVLADGQSVADFFATLPPDTLSIEGDAVVTTGIVTAVDSNGFYLQDATGDGNDNTSDAVFVFTSSAPTVSVGDEVQVSATVAEFFPGDTDTRNLPTTQLVDPEVQVLSVGNALPAATILGSNGRLVPDATIDDDAFASYDPATDGIDFFESVEGMLVTAEDLVAVSGTNQFGEIFAVTDNGEFASGLGDRGALNLSADDFNPEKIQIDEDSAVFDFAFPDVNAGDFLGDVTGVVSYSFGNFEIVPTADFTATIVSADLAPEVTTLTGDGDNQLTIATYNVLNLDPNDSDGDTDVADGRFDAIADQIVNGLASPDIIGLQEIQDNSGSVDDGVVSAEETLQLLVDAIVAAGGPEYQIIDNTFITDGASGGQPGGNIRTAFLYNPEEVTLVEDSVQTISGQGSGEAFEGARLPLVATFEFNGEEITVVNNHFSSKGGSAPILGIEQNFEDRQEDVSVNGSLDERQAQSEAVQGFVEGLLAVDPGANVVVLGDLNEFEFVSPVTGLEEAGLTNLINTIPDGDRYTFNFQGNAQTLDHILVSDSLADGAEVDIVHVNSEFAVTDGTASDHDPVLASLTFEVSSQAPVAIDDIATLDLDQGETSGKIEVLDNDSDADGDALTLEFFDDSATSGLVIQNADGTFTYDANGFFAYLDAGETATDTFNYTISDGELTDIATVTVTIDGPADVTNSGTSFSFSQDTNGGANRFGFDGDSFFISGQGVSGQLKFDDFDDFLKKAAEVFNGEIKSVGTINDQALPSGQGPNNVSVINTNEVEIGGRATDGNYRIEFGNSQEADTFKTFVERMLTEIDANNAVATDATDFRFDALTGTDEDATRIFFDDVNDQFGFTTDGGATQTRFDELELFVEAIAIDLFGGDQIRDGSFNDGRIAAGKIPNGIQVNGDDVIITGQSVGGRFQFDFDAVDTAEAFAGTVRELFGNIAEAGAIAGV